MRWFLCRCWWGFGSVSAFAGTWVNLLVQPKHLNIHFTFGKPRGISPVLLPAGPQLWICSYICSWSLPWDFAKEKVHSTMHYWSLKKGDDSCVICSCRWWICLGSPSRFCREVLFVVNFLLPFLMFSFFPFFPPFLPFFPPILPPLSHSENGRKLGCILKRRRFCLAWV